MSTSSIQINNQNRLLTERVSQQETAGPQIVDVQGINVISAGVAAQPLPTYLQNSSSKAMNVDGSVADVNFDIAPGANDCYRVNGIRLFMRCATAIGFTTFGDIAALGSGDGVTLLITDGTTTQADLFGGDEIRTTEDLLPHCSRFELLDSGTLLIADIDIPGTARINGATPLLVRAAVRADLTAITELTMLGLVENETVLV